MSRADEPSNGWAIAAVGLAAGVGLVLAAVALAHSGQTGSCPKPNPLPTWIIGAAAAVSFISFVATISERMGSRWDRWARAIQVVSFLALVLCFFAWERGGVSAFNCGD